MKVAFVNDGIHQYASGDPSAVGGAERQQWLLARALAATGWSVKVGIRYRLEEGRRETIDGVDYVGIGIGPYLPAIFRFLRSERPNWFYLRCAQPLLGPIVQLARMSNVRTIFSAGFDTDMQPREALTRRRRLWPLYAWGLARAEKLFLQHGRQLSELPEKWRSKAYIVRSIEGARSSVKSHALRDKYVAWIGMLRWHKRPDLLIEIARKAPALQFVLCGGQSTFGTTVGYSEQIVNCLRALPNVNYRGQVSPEHAEGIIQNAAVLLSTSHSEGFPNTFLQAWSNGTPVVSLEIDPDDIIKRYGLGAISNGVVGAVKDITRLLASADQRDDIAVHAQRYVTEYHSDAAVVEAFEAAVSEASLQAQQ